jgi:hypothetical protein
MNIQIIQYMAFKGEKRAQKYKKKSSFKIAIFTKPMSNIFFYYFFQLSLYGNRILLRNNWTMLVTCHIASKTYIGGHWYIII